MAVGRKQGCDRFGLMVVVAIKAVLVSTGDCAAQVVPDTTLPQNSAVTVNGNNFTITGGTQLGGNLFHSFSQFSVPTLGEAFFNNNPSTVQNIISRVTGSSVSNIDGILRANGTANLFLLNPNGIIFGQNARLDVGGSFVATTANAIRLGDTGFFSASAPASSNLLTVNPSALFFNVLNTQARIINSSTAQGVSLNTNQPTFGLQVPNGHLALVGGDVTLQGGIIQAPGGRVELGGLASPGTVGLSFDGSNLSLGFPNDAVRADVSLVASSTNPSGVNVAAAGGGDIIVNARNLNISGGSFLYAGIGANLGTVGAQAGNIIVNATNGVTIDGTGSTNATGIYNRVGSQGSGNAGDIIINTGFLSLINGAQLSNNTFGTGNAGNVNIDVGNAVTVAGVNNGFASAVFSTVESGGVGKGGNIDLKAGSLSISDGAQLLSIVRGASDTHSAGQRDAGNINIDVRGAAKLDEVNVLPSGIFSSGILSYVDSGVTGNAGNINVKAGSLDITNGAQLVSSTFGTGNAGDVSIDVGDAVTIAGVNNGIASAVFSTVEPGGVGKGGNINLKAGSLSLTDGGQLLTIVRQASGGLAAGRGDAGNITVDVRGAAKLDGVNVLPSGILSGVDYGVIGNAGNINLKAGSLDITNGARLLSSTFGTGNAGNVSIDVGNGVTVAGVNNGFISAVFSTVEPGGLGKGGNIDLKAGSLSISDGAQLQTIVREVAGELRAGQGSAGNINIDVRGEAKLDGVNRFPSGIFSSVNPGVTGNAGNINVKAGSLDITNGARLSSSTFGTGDAGNVSIDVRSGVTLAGVNGFTSAVLSTVERGGVGKGGNINVKAGSLDITNGAQLSSSTLGTGDAGNVSIDVGNGVTLAGVKNGSASAVFSTVEPGGVGKGGNIDLKAGSLSISDGAQLLSIVRQASGTQPAGQGNAGNINIDVRGEAKLDGVNVFPSGIFSEVQIGVTGNAGNINLKAGSLDITNGARLSSSTFGRGDAGNVSIDVRSGVTLAGVNGFTSAVLSTVEPGGVGKGGNIDLKAGSLEITNGAQLLSSTFGTGNAGNVSIDVGNGVTLAGVKNGSASAVFSTVEPGGVGNGGNIDLKAGSLSITNGAQLQTIVRQASGTQPAGQGNAGNINIDVRGEAKLDGVNRFPSGIFSEVQIGVTGNAGNINLKAGSLDITNGARLSSSTFGKGDAGNVSIDVGNGVTLAGVNNGLGSAVYSTVEPGGVGKGGNIDLKAGSLSLADGAQLQTLVRQASGGLAAGRGDAGNINIDVRGEVNLDGINGLFPSSIFTIVEPGVIGNAGGINIKARSLSLTNQAQLNSSTLNTGNAGTIEVTAGSIRLDNQGKISAETASGQGGNIILNAQDFLLLRRNSQISATAGTSQQGGNGGNITINSPFIISVPQENSDITANAFNGQGGRVTINTRGIFFLEPRSRQDLQQLLQTSDPTQLDPARLPTNDITAISQNNPDFNGLVTINSPDIDSNLGLINLPTDVVDASGLVDTSCAALGSQGSSFVATGRGGLPPSPDEPLGNDVVWTDTRLPNISSGQKKTASVPIRSQSVVQINPATGWVFNGKGEVTLTSHSANNVNNYPTCHGK